MTAHETRLYCPKCGTYTAHAAEGGVTDMGQVWHKDRCRRCGNVGTDHEVPWSDPQVLADAGLSDRLRHLQYMRWLVRQRIVSDYPVIAASQQPGTIAVGGRVVRVNGFSVRGTIDGYRR